MKYATLVVVICMISAVHADVSMKEIVYDIQDDDSVRQITTIFLDQPTSGTMKYTLDEDDYDVSVSDGTRPVPFSMESAGGNLILTLDLQYPTQTIRIFSLTRELVFKSDTENHFFVEYNASDIPFMTVQAYLPKGYGIVGRSFKPANSNISSDGQRIFLAWNIENQSEPVLFSVKYVDMTKENGLYITIILFLIAGMIALSLHFKKRSFDTLLKGFRDDEKKTIMLLKEKGTLLQSDLQKQFGFSRSKATRIVMHLESKGFVGKQKYGRTNKLSWLKK